jgi:hypothetical protein
MMLRRAALSACCDGAENFLGCRHMPGLSFGEDQFAVGKYVQDAAAAQVQLYFVNSGLLFQFAFQAPSLTANVSSKKTALNVNFHQSRSSLFRCA